MTITITKDRAELINNSADFREALAAGAEIQLRRRGQFYGRTIDEDDLRRAAENRNDGCSTFEVTSARELLDCLWYVTPETFYQLSPENREEAAWIVELADAHGWETPLYRADDISGEGIYSPNQIEGLDAFIAYANHDAEQLIALYRVPANEEEAAWIVDLAENGTLPGNF